MIDPTTRSTIRVIPTFFTLGSCWVRPFSVFDEEEFGVAVTTTFGKGEDEFMNSIFFLLTLLFFFFIGNPCIPKDFDRSYRVFYELRRIHKGGQGSGRKLFSSNVFSEHLVLISSFVHSKSSGNRKHEGKKLSDQSKQQCSPHRIDHNHIPCPCIIEGRFVREIIDRINRKSQKK